MKRAAFLIFALSVGAAHAQSAAPAASAAPPAPPPPSTEVAAPGMRIVSAQAPVVGGNAAGARERALDEAIRQAVDQALGEIMDAPTRAAQAKTIKIIEARARSFVPRYRTLEEGEANGVYTVRLEAEVDELALRRRIERGNAPTSGNAPAANAPRGAPAALLIVAGERGAGPAPFANELVAALLGAGLRARGAGEGATDNTPATAAQAAARAGFGQAALATADAAEEGAVRGTGRFAFSCRATVRVVAAGTGAPLGERNATTRVFAERPEGGRAECLTRLAAELAPRLAGAAGAAAASSAPGDLHALTVDADVAEPAAVPALLKSVRSVGAVSSAELQRVAPGRAEIKLRTRSAPAPLAAALARDAAPAITLSDVNVAGDVIHLRARLRAPANGATP